MIRIVPNSNFLRILFITIVLLLIVQGCYRDSKSDGSPVSPGGYWNSTFLEMAYFTGLLKLVDTEPEIPSGIEVEYHRLRGLPHTMDLAVVVNEYCQFYMNAFFEKYLKNKNIH